MTLLNKPLRRETDVTPNLDTHSRGRPIIIELEPAHGLCPALISFRFKGTRRKYSAPISWLCQKTIEAEAARIRREKQAKRKQRRINPR